MTEGKPVPTLQTGVVMPDLERFSWAVLLTVWQVWTFLILTRGQRARTKASKPVAP